MAAERTLSIIKPDAVAKNLAGAIIGRFENAGLKVVAAKMLRLTRAQAERFYFVHKERPFYDGLVDFMISGPILVQVLEGENAIRKNRELIGATKPAEAEPGTIRADFGVKDGGPQNAVHGSDGPESAEAEIAFFFSKDELFAHPC